jgi:hypothetical protein
LSANLQSNLCNLRHLRTESGKLAPQSKRTPFHSPLLTRRWRVCYNACNVKKGTG